MKKRITSFVTLCTLFGLLFIASVAIGETITGFLTINNELITDDGLIYQIEQNEQGDKLLEAIGETVEVSGLVKNNEGVMTIKVSDFSVVVGEEESSKEESEKTSDQ